MELVTKSPPPQNVSQPAKEVSLSHFLYGFRNVMFTKPKGHSYRPDSHHQQAAKMSRHRTLHIPIGSQTATPNKGQGRQLLGGYKPHTALDLAPPSQCH